MRRTCVLLAVLSLGACANGQGAATPDASLASADPDRMICTYEKVTGQHRPEKRCMTAARREELREATQSGLLNRSQERPNRASDKGGVP